MTALTRIAGRREGRAAIVALLLLLLAVDVALAYSITRPLLFSGRIFDVGEVTVSSAWSNDDGVEQEAGGFDAGDNGNDPDGPASLTPPYLPITHRADSNVQRCEASIVGGEVHVAMTDTFDALRCALKVRVRNVSSRPLLYIGATIEGAPVALSQDPNAGVLCMMPGEEPSVHLELTPEADAVPGSEWAEADARIVLTFEDTPDC